MGLVPGLPGTTFSDVGQRGSYDSDKAACLTLEEAEHRLAVAVAKYCHHNPHKGLDGQTPIGRWREGLAMLQAGGGGIPIERLSDMTTSAVVRRLVSRTRELFGTPGGRAVLDGLNAMGSRDRRRRSAARGF